MEHKDSNSRDKSCPVEVVVHKRSDIAKMDMEKVIRIIDELIFEAQKETTWKAENALRCLKKELLKEQEAKTGTWIEKTDYMGDTYYDCSVCGESWTTIDGTPWQNGMNYCPHCGAKMET